MLMDEKEKKKLEEIVENLELCPFCGEKMVYDEEDDFIGHSEIPKDDCPCGMFMILCLKDVEIWNKRSYKECQCPSKEV